MSTTALYAELIVIGTGAAISILLLFYCLTGDSSLLVKLGELTPLVSAIPIVSIIYLLGVINSNLGHLVFKPFEKRMNCHALAKSYGEIRNTIQTTSHTDLVDDFHFRRTKIRICRGWFINSFLIIVALFIGACKGHIGPLMARFWIPAIGLLMIATVVSWWNSTDSELDSLGFFDKGYTTLIKEV